MTVVRNTFRLKYTNFIFTHDSALDKEEKNKYKMLFFALFLFDIWENQIKRIC